MIREILISAIPLLLVISTSEAQTNPKVEKAAPKANHVKLDIAELDASLILNIKSSLKNSSPDKNYFNGLKDCTKPNAAPTDPLLEDTGKCLEFQTDLSTQPIVQVPIFIFKGDADPKAFQILIQYYEAQKIKVQQDKKQTFKWGTAYFWSTETKGSAHYLFITPKNKKLAVQIGPISETLFSMYELKWSFKAW